MYGVRGRLLVDYIIAYIIVDYMIVNIVYSSV